MVTRVVVCKIVLSACIAGCASLPPDVSEQVRTWYEIQDKYAAALRENVGTTSNIVAVKGFIFPIGTPLNPGTSLVRSIACSIPDEGTVAGPFASHPVITVYTTWQVLAQPLELGKLLPDVHAGHDVARYLQVAYTDLTYRLLPDVGIDNYYRKSAQCLKDVKGQEIVVVRGYIYGRMRIHSQGHQTSSGSATIRKIGSMELRYTEQGDIALEDNENRPRFTILSRVFLSEDCPTCPIVLTKLSRQAETQTAEKLAILDPIPPELTKLPAYQFFIVRSRLSELVLAAVRCRARITEVYAEGGRTPGANNWACETPTSRNVANVVTTEDGAITVTASGIGPQADGKTLTLTPLIDGEPARFSAHMGRVITNWRCGSTQDGTTLPREYLPASCRD